MCVGGCKRLFLLSCVGGETRAPSSSSTLRTIGPAQSAGRVWPGERVWLERGSDAKGRSFSRFSPREGVCRQRKRRRQVQVELAVWKTESLREGVLVCEEQSGS